MASGPRNGDGVLFRLEWDGTKWLPDTDNDWGAGKTLKYTDGAGRPDAEGVGFTTSSAAGIYVATERNSDASSVNRNATLLYDVSAAGTTLTASKDWNVIGLLPAVGANLGLEAITWIPDGFLTGAAFYDENLAKTYDPADYADHAGGLFFVGVEANGAIYAFALNHTSSAASLVATIDSGFTGVRGLEFDRDTNDLWAACDDNCGGTYAVLRIDGVTGMFEVTHAFARPSEMANLNNEGFAIADADECTGGAKPVFWADDGQTSGYAILAGTVTCSALP